MPQTQNSLESFISNPGFKHKHFFKTLLYVQCAQFNKNDYNISIGQGMNLKRKKKSFLKVESYTTVKLVVDFLVPSFLKFLQDILRIY